MSGRAIVLVVEDEPDVRELIADVLAENGYEIEVAADGAAALQLCDERRYDLILSDLRMPKMDGAALYWALQLRHGSAMPRIIYVTGQAHSMDYAGFLAASRVPVISKRAVPSDSVSPTCAPSDTSSAGSTTALWPFWIVGQADAGAETISRLEGRSSRMSPDTMCRAS